MSLTVIVAENDFSFVTNFYSEKTKPSAAAFYSEADVSLDLYYFFRFKISILHIHLHIIDLKI